MELFQERDHFIIQKGEHALWCSRFDGALVARHGADICNAWNPICLGKICGVIGKMKIHPEAEWKLLLVKQQELVGQLPGGANVFRINKIAILPLCLDEPKDLDIDLCSKHHFGIQSHDRISKVPETQQRSLQKTWNSIKSAAENVKPKKLVSPKKSKNSEEKTHLPFKLPVNISDFGALTQPSQQRDLKDKEKFERRVVEELLRMFNDSSSFYYSPEGDLTNSIQQQHIREQDPNVPLWARADDRFFWNKFMLQDLVKSKDPLADPWIIPVIQGYIQIENCKVDLNNPDDMWGSFGARSPSPAPPGAMDVIEYKITLLSRRSRHRAGSRYKRRGVNEFGHVANYVETEQILEFSHHVVSFVQVRGSVPLYWSQTGIKYKPPPRIEKGEKENREAFQKHFAEELQLHQRLAVINLVDQTGKEKVIADAFLNHVVQFNNPFLVYVAFDFHEYCRGMKFENVAILIDNIKDIIKEMRYCWVDRKGIICDQRGMFRVNCIDCLDRTNIVQSAIAKVILEIQCRKLGLLPPDQQLPGKARMLYQQMWANNGDAISRQYAGTAALKGDFTRTGERNLKGMMKDGMNSANRYYLNRFKDIYRQATIDLMLGNAVAEEIVLLTTASKTDLEDDNHAVLVEKEENLKTLIEECKKMLITEPEDCLGSWGLIDCDPVTGDPTQQDTDVILLLSQRAYYIASYDDDIDQVTSYQKVFLEDLEKIEIGPAPALFKSKHICIRIYYKYEDESGYFHTFRPTSTRLFNNIVITIKNEEEAKESLRAISESFSAAHQIIGLNLDVSEVKLERKKTKPHMDIINIFSQAQLNTWSKMTASISRENSGMNLRNLPNMMRRPVQTEFGARIGKTFAGLNPMKKVKLNRLIKGTVAKGFLPAVMYSKDSDQQSSTDSLERAKILKGDHIVSANESFNMAQTGVDGAALAKGIEALDDEDLMVLSQQSLDQHDVMLASCGILATKQHKLLNSMLEGKRAMSVDALHRLTNETRHQRSLSCKGSLQRPKSRPKSYSLDIRDDAETESPKARLSADIGKKVTILSPQMEELAFSVSPRTENGLPCYDTSIPLFDNLSLSAPDQTGSESSRSVSPSIDIQLAEDGKLSLGDQGPSVDETWVNIEGPLKPDELMNAGAEMKVSLSDGSLAYHEELAELTMNPQGALPPGGGPLNPFSKLKGKMTGLNLPLLPSPQARRRQFETTALENKEKSQLRFSELKTQIILL